MLKILKQTKKLTTVELDPLELEILRGAVVKEASSRNRIWNQVNPQYPEELVYHASMKDTADRVKAGIYKIIEQYRRWGILK